MDIHIEASIGLEVTRTNKSLSIKSGADSGIGGGEGE
jgi:hypothetical protein